MALARHQCIQLCHEASDVVRLQQLFHFFARHIRALHGEAKCEHIGKMFLQRFRCIQQIIAFRLIL